MSYAVRALHLSNRPTHNQPTAAEPMGAMTQVEGPNVPKNFVAPAPQMPPGSEAATGEAGSLFRTFHTAWSTPVP